MRPKFKWRQQFHYMSKTFLKQALDITKKCKNDFPKGSSCRVFTLTGLAAKAGKDTFFILLARMAGKSPLFS